MNNHRNSWANDHNDFFVFFFLAFIDSDTLEKNSYRMNLWSIFWKCGFMVHFPSRIHSEHILGCYHRFYNQNIKHKELHFVIIMSPSLIIIIYSEKWKAIYSNNGKAFALSKMRVSFFLDDEIVCVCGSNVEISSIT